MVHVDESLFLGFSVHHHHGADGVVAVDKETNEEDDEPRYEELIVLIPVVAEHDKASKHNQHAYPVDF